MGDDGIDRLRDDDEHHQALASEVAELTRSLATLNTKLDSLAAHGSSPGTREH